MAGLRNAGALLHHAVRRHPAPVLARSGPALTHTHSLTHTKDEFSGMRTCGDVHPTSTQARVVRTHSQIAGLAYYANFSQTNLESVR